MPNNPPWYADGLCFECQRCGACCRGEPGYVWVSEEDIERMAKALGMAPSEFARAHTRRVGLRRSLKELPGGDCVMWGGTRRGCIVYEVRPLQCRTFPFWPEHVRSQEAWERLAGACPGLNKGRLYPHSEIADRLNRRS